MSNYFSDLKGFNNINSPTLTNEILDSVVSYFDWGLLRKGNYFNVDLSEAAPNTYDMSKLALASNVAAADSGRVWEGFRKNWVWESGIGYSPEPNVGSDNTNPGISGVYVNGAFYPSDTTGDYAHYVDYLNGRVVFNNALPTGTLVQAEYSYKWINVMYAAELPWMKIQQDSYQPTANFFSVGRGNWDLDPEAKIQLPAIAVEVIPKREFAGYQMGGGQWVRTDLLFYVLAEDEPTRDKLMDIVSLQNDKTIFLFNSNSISASGDFPLDRYGTPASGALRYPDLVAAHPGGKLKFTKTVTSSVDFHKNELWGASIRTTAEGIKLDI